MKDRYHLDLKSHSLEQFKHKIANRELIPSRRALKTGLEENFQVLAKVGIETHQDLIDALKTKQKIAATAAQTGLSVEYLTLLGREARSYLPNPFRLDKLPGVSGAAVEQLADLGIKNTRQAFNRLGSASEREALSDETGIPQAALEELHAQSDLARAYGVGPAFARLIYDLGICSLEDFTGCTAEEFIRLYEEHTGKKADFSQGEIQFSIDLAREQVLT